MFPSLTGGLAGIGQGLGTAHGSIVIDTSSLGQAIQQARTGGRTIGQALQQGIGGGARQAVQGLSSLRRELQTFNRELTVIGATAGAATFFGLRAARDIRAYRIAYETLLGSQREGDRIMRNLADSANQYGLELNSVLGLGRALIPILGDNADATDEWVVRAARLRAVLPTAQQGAELRAITEFLADQTISLQRLFNIPPELIQEARRQFSDAGRQLDFILDRMGATEEAARRMADPVVSLKNELRLIAAVGFGPLLEDIRDVATDFRKWLEDVRETHPELLKIGASAVAAVAIGAPLLVFLNQIAELLIKIRGLSILGTVARAGGAVAVGVGALGLGGAIGLGLGRGIGRATGNEQVANTTAADVLNTIRQVIFIAFDSFTKLGNIAAISYANAINNVISGLELFARALGFLVETIGKAVPDALGGNRIEGIGQGIQEFADTIGSAKINMEDFLSFLESRRQLMLAGFLRFLMPSSGAQQEEPTPTVGGGQGRLGQLFRDTVANAVPGGLAEWTRFWAEMNQIQRDAQAEILAAELEHQAQRQEIVASFNRQLVREEEDFQRQRSRAQEDFQRQIDSINEDRIEREAAWQEQLNERIAEIQADAARERERMEQDHRDNMLSAASRLDARAVAEENRRFARQITRFEEDLQERINSEQEAHQERLQQAREADQERIQELREFHERRLAREDEDRAIRLERMQEDHERQLEEFDNQHQRRIDQIEQQASDELAAAADGYRDRLREQGIFYTGMLTEQTRRQGDMLNSWQQFWRDMERAQGTGQAGGGRTGDSGRGGAGQQPMSRQEMVEWAIELMQGAGWDPRAVYNYVSAFERWPDSQIASWLESVFGVDVPGYLLGTQFVPRTGPAMLHRGEMVLPPAMAEYVRSRAPAFSAPQVAGALTGGRNIQMGDVNLHVQGSANMNETQLKRAVRQGLMDALREVAA